MTKKISFGIVGFGSIAKHHIACIQNIANAELLAITSSNAIKRKAAAKEYGVLTFDKLENMLALDDLDVLCICTPNGYHLEPCLAAAKYGKHVITEKPLEITPERCEKMIHACREAGVILSCVFQNRYIPGYLKLRHIVNEGHLGKLILANVSVKWFRPPSYYENNNWRGTLKGDGGAALITQSIHYLDQLLHVMGPAKSVSAFTKTLYHNIEGEDIGTAIVEFENGALATIDGSTAIYAGYPEKLEIHGSEGSIILESGKIIDCKLKTPIELQLDKIEGTTSASTDPTAVALDLHIAQFEHIIDCILYKKEPDVNGEEAIKVIKLLSAIYESSKTGKHIYL
jgi:UDP-N-acetyl-2-amino-2-deoxyglucuronate dehydrogenase